MFFNPSRLEVAYCIVSFLLDFEDTMLKLKSADQPHSGLGSFISSSKLTGYCLTLIILILVNLVDESDGGGTGGQDQLDLPSVAAHSSLIHRFPQKIRHVRGKYKHKEEVVKKIEHDHPCKLTEAAVKITFPGMKDQVLVSFLGYKEPNLVPVLRCKGLCGNEALSPVACVPTKLRYRKVKMQIKTQYLGHESKEKYRELVLEEHEECGCRCLNVRPEHCMEPSLFNNETCSCKCDTSLYNRDQIRCETFNDRTWDPVTCTCRHIEEGRLLDGPKQGDDARKAAEAAGINPGDGQYHDHRHHHKKSSRPGHDVDPAVVSWVGEDELGKTRVAVMPKHAQNSSINNGWMAIAICTFLVIVFATTTVYYWQKAKKMAKDLFAEKEANDQDEDDDDDDEDIEVPSPPPKPSGKKPFDPDNETALNSPLSLQKVMLNNHNQIGLIKSPVEIVKKLCDNKSKLSNHVNMHPKGSSSSHLLLNGLVKGSPKVLSKSGSKSKIIDPNEENARMMIDSSDSEPELELNGAASDSPEVAENIEVTMAKSATTAPHKNLMELLLAAAAKRDNSNKHQYHNQSNGIAKAASMSELEASQLEPDHHHRSQNLQPNHHRSHHHHHHHHDHDHRQMHNHRNGASSRSVNHHKSNFSVNREIVTTRVSNQSSNARQHKRSTSNYNNDELEAIEHAIESDFGPPCNECVHASLLRPTASTAASTHSKRPPARNQQPPRHMLQHQHSFHHPHPPQAPPSEAQHPYRPQHHNSHTLDRRHHRRSNASSTTRPRSRLYHGSFGQLLDDEDLLQQCLATLMMDAAILRQQQQIQQEQLQLQQEQLQQQQSVIEKQKYAKSMKAATAASKAAEAAEATDTQSVIESIAGDGATVVTVDRLEVSVEVVDDGEQSPVEDQGDVLDGGLDRGC